MANRAARGARPASANFGYSSGRSCLASASWQRKTAGTLPLPAPGTANFGRGSGRKTGTPLFLEPLLKTLPQGGGQKRHLPAMDRHLPAQALEIDRHQSRRQQRRQRRFRTPGLARCPEMIAGAQDRLPHGGGNTRIILQHKEFVGGEPNRRQKIERQVKLVAAIVKAKRTQQS